MQASHFRKPTNLVLIKGLRVFSHLATVIRLQGLPRTRVMETSDLGGVGV